MRITSVFAVIGLVAIVMASGLLAGCLDGGDDTVTLTIAGSTTVLPVAQQCADAYMDENSEWDIQVSGGGSSVGVRSAAEGTADIGMASREVKSSEMDEWPDLVPTAVAKDGIAVIVNTGNPVTGLTLAQIKDIYTGAVTNWNEVGGDNMEIVVIGRDSNSGTRATFEELALDDAEVTSAMLEKNSNGAVKQTVIDTPGAIGYVGLGYVDSDVTGLEVDGVVVNEANVVNGDYPISRSLYVITDGEPTGNAKEFIDFMLSSEGQDIVEEEGFIRLG